MTIETGLVTNGKTLGELYPDKIIITEMKKELDYLSKNYEVSLRYIKSISRNVI